MKIGTPSSHRWISIERKKPYVETVRVHVDYSRGSFEATCHDVLWHNACAFVNELDRFILDRSRTPRLEGTYGNYIAFTADGPGVMVEYYIGYWIGFGRWRDRHHLTGRFSLDQQYLLQMLAGFREHWPGCPETTHGRRD